MLYFLVPQRPTSRGTLDAVPPERRHLPPLAVFGLALLAACGGPFPQSTLAPVSDFGHDVDKLFTGIFWWAVVVFVLVEGLLLYSVLRFRHREGAPAPRQHEGHTGLEITWTLAPALILVFIAVPTVRTIFKTAGTPPPGAIRVEVIGHQWWWEYRYPDLGIVTANELHLPVGKPVKMLLRSIDVLHDFYVPEFRAKMDMIPGMVTYYWFTPTKTGTYEVLCAELCGVGHPQMRGKVVVDEQVAYQAWLEKQQTFAQLSGPSRMAKAMDKPAPQ